jgi:hypothetical protein
MREAVSAVEASSGQCPEWDLLLCCARSDDQRGASAERLPEDVDWARLLRLAEFHGLRPLLFRRLQSIGAENKIPKPVYAELWSRDRALLRRNTQMLSELLEVLGALQGLGIPAVPYKGPMLALQAYGELQMREFGDLDLLLRRSDVLAAKQVLLDRGYRSAFELGPDLEARMLESRAHYHLMLVRESDSMLVELHWRTDPEFAVESSQDPAWWRNLGSVQMDGIKVSCLPPTESLLTLLLHGSKHFWSSLGWLVDVARLIEREPEIDWTWLLAKADSLRARRRVALGFFLLVGFLQLQLPAEVEVWMAREASVRRVAGSIRRRLREDPYAAWTPAERLSLHFQLCEGVDQKLRHVVDDVLRPGLVEWSSAKLPAPLSFLYYPIRWSRLAGKHLGKLVQRGAA